MEKVIYFRSKPFRIFAYIVNFLLIAAYVTLLIFAFSPYALFGIALIGLITWAIIYLNCRRIIIAKDRLIICDIAKKAIDKRDIVSIDCERHIVITTKVKRVTIVGYMSLRSVDLDKNIELVNELKKWASIK